MMNKEMLKKWAADLGLDLVGVASMDRYADVPPQWNPKSILPGVRSVIAIAKEIPRGQFKGIEEGTFWISVGRQTHPWYAYDLCRRFEDQGILAVPCSPLAQSRWPDGVVFDGAVVAPNVTPSLEYAATAAGLGEVGYNGLFLTPEFGIRQQLGLLFTECELEPDPLFEGGLCGREDCAACVTECPVGAMGGTKMADYGAGEIAVSDIDYKKCRYCVNGAFPDTSHHLAPPNRICAACARACIACLEDKGLTRSNHYKKPFRTKPPWGVGLFKG